MRQKQQADKHTVPMTYIAQRPQHHKPQNSTIQQSNGVWNGNMLDTICLQWLVLDKENNATLGAVEALPKREMDTPWDDLLGRDILHSEQLLTAPNNIVVGQETAPVLTPFAVCHYPGLIQHHHYVGAIAVYLRPQCPWEGDLQHVWWWLLERCLHDYAKLNYSQVHQAKTMLNYNNKAYYSQWTTQMFFLAIIG